MYIIVLCLIGIAVSLYSYYVEFRLKKVQNYRPFCDISNSASCSKPFKSGYSHLFYIPNSIMGILFYIVIIGFAHLNYLEMVLRLAILGALVTIILGYILFFKIRSFCLLCVSIYMINILILILVLKKVY